MSKPFSSVIHEATSEPSKEVENKSTGQATRGCKRTGRSDLVLRRPLTCNEDDYGGEMGNGDKRSGLTGCWQRWGTRDWGSSTSGIGCGDGEGGWGSHAGRDLAEWGDRCPNWGRWDRGSRGGIGGRGRARARRGGGGGTRRGGCGGRGQRRGGGRGGLPLCKTCMAVVGVSNGEEGKKSDEGVEVHGDQGTKKNDEGERLRLRTSPIPNNQNYYFIQIPIYGNLIPTCSFRNAEITCRSLGPKTGNRCTEPGRLTMRQFGFSSMLDLIKVPQGRSDTQLQIHTLHDQILPLISETMHVYKVYDCHATAR